ncbi:MAG: hypothetical protein IT537_04095 [Hyphomicrobiales bacterium]|nr:hypothetical protein [Hyphomicrobiales bacterium]
MMKSLAFGLAALVVVANCATADAAGLRRGWRGGAVGAISRGVITPWYVGYFGSHYSYYRPDPTYLPVAPGYLPSYADSDRCWGWIMGERVFIC